MNENLDQELPPEFLAGLDDRARWMYQTLNNHGRVLASICDTQTRILERMEKGDTQFIKLEREVLELKQARLVLRSTWAVVALLIGGVIWPVLLMILTHWVKTTFPG